MQEVFSRSAAVERGGGVHHPDKQGWGCSRFLPRVGYHCPITAAEPPHRGPAHATSTVTLNTHATTTSTQAGRTTKESPLFSPLALVWLHLSRLFSRCPPLRVGCSSGCFTSFDLSLFWHGGEARKGGVFSRRGLWRELDSEESEGCLGGVRDVCGREKRRREAKEEEEDVKWKGGEGGSFTSVQGTLRWWGWPPRAQPCRRPSWRRARSSLAPSPSVCHTAPQRHPGRRRQEERVNWADKDCVFCFACVLASVGYLPKTHAINLASHLVL